jgi:hypothetical protein
LTDDGRKLPTQSLQVCNLSLDLGEVLPRNSIDSRAGPILLVRQAQERAHVLDGKAQVAPSV